MSPRIPFALLLAAPGLLHAQVRASEAAVVAQTIDGTKLTVEYSRPRIRGREPIFGKVVTWGEVWTPGANWATTLEVSKDVTLDEHRLPAGKYSVWLVVRKDGPWTAVFDPRHKRFHTMHPDSTGEQIRYPVTPQEAPVTESLTWGFEELSVSGAALVMEWGKVRIPFRIRVTPSYSVKMPAEESAPYLGTYSFAWEGGPDSSKPIDLFVTYENGSLMARWDPAPFPEWDRFILIPRSPGKFLPGFLEKGALYDVEQSMIFEFKFEGGKPMAFEVRTDTDQKIASGARKP
jgi:hypothetical protein